MFVEEADMCFTLRWVHAIERGAFVCISEKGILKVKKSLVFAVAAFGLMSLSTTASAFSTGVCKSCHALDKDMVGPAWNTVAKAYGSSDELAKVFKSGFAVADRKVASSNPKWKGMAATMTGAYGSFIKGHEDDAAKALFAAVKSGKM